MTPRHAPSDPSSSRPGVLQPHELGSGRLETGAPNGRPQKLLRIDATGGPSTLLGRLLVGSYITGQDHVIVTARGGLSPAQRREIHRVVDRLLGMTVVVDEPGVVEVQNFVDPGKYELARLLHRLVHLLQEEVRAVDAALQGSDGSVLERLAATEEEVDQLYLLMARQLLLSSDSPRVARDIDVQSHHYQIGYRLVAKALEVLGDLVEAMGSDVREHLAGLQHLPRAISRELVSRLRRLDGLLERTLAALERISVADADATLNDIVAALSRDPFLGPVIARRVVDRKVAVAAQRIVCNLVMALEMLVIVNETTINRGVEPESNARQDSQVLVGAFAGSRPLRLSRPLLPPT